MPLLRFSTDQGQASLSQFRRAVEAMRTEVATAYSSTNTLVGGAWEAPAAHQFLDQVTAWRQQSEGMLEVLTDLNNRLEREIEQWEATAAVFGGGGGIIGTGSHGDVFSADAGFGVSGSESVIDMPSPHGVERWIFSADELLNYEPDYIGTELGDRMFELHSYIQYIKEYANSDSSASHPVLNDLARLTGLSPAETEAQVEKLLNLMERAEENAKANDLPLPIYENVGKMPEHWGSRKQLLFGKVVGDNLGLHPVFGALLNPSGGLIGPGDSLGTTGVLEPVLGGKTHTNAIDYHGATHDAAGYLYNYHNTGPGYEYASGDFLSQLFQGDLVLPTSSPLSGQESGIDFWNDQLKKQS